MKKKKSSTKPFVADEILNVEGVDLPEAFADIAKKYYDAFLCKGFTTDQAYELMVLIIRGYVIRM